MGCLGKPQSCWKLTGPALGANQCPRTVTFAQLPENSGRRREKGNKESDEAAARDVERETQAGARSKGGQGTRCCRIGTSTRVVALVRSDGPAVAAASRVLTSVRYAWRSDGAARTSVLVQPMDPRKTSR